MQKILLLSLLLSFRGNLFAQNAPQQDNSKNQGNSNAIAKLISAIDTGTNNNITSIGFSFASRTIFKKFRNTYQSASISPIDSTLKLQNADPHDFVLSTSIVITPFINSNFINSQLSDTSGKHLLVKKIIYTLIKNFGFTVNINLIDFANAQTSYSFNKSLEGGIGGALRISPKIFIGVSGEVVQSTQLTDAIKAKVNQKIYNNGQVVTSLSQIEPGNSNYFVTRNLIAQYWRIIIILK